MKSKTNILIIGAGEAAMMLLKEYSLRKTLHLIVGLVDDNPARNIDSCYGKQLIGTIKNIKRVLEDYSIGQVIIAMPSVSPQIINRIILHKFS